MQSLSEISPDLRELVAPGETLRKLSLGVVAAMQTARLSAHRWYMRRQARRQLRAAFAEMRHLDDRMLRDMGFDPGVPCAIGAVMPDDPRTDRSRFALSYYDFLR